MTEEIDREVKDIVDNAHHIALAILSQNKHILEETAQELLTKEVMEGDSLRDRLSQATPPVELTDWLLKGKLPEGVQLLQETTK